MIACTSPASLHADETMRTLNYATRARNIVNKPVIRVNPKEQVLFLSVYLSLAILLERLLILLCSLLISPSLLTVSARIEGREQTTKTRKRELKIVIITKQHRYSFLLSLLDFILFSFRTSHSSY
jgi:hypothetical protein